MPVGTNGDSIYRPHNAPPGTVCTGDGIGVQIRNGDGDVIAVIGLHDGKIYMGDAWADPNIANVAATTVIQGPVVPSPQPGPSSVMVGEVEYRVVYYEREDGGFQELRIRADLFDQMAGGGMTGVLATMIVGASLADLAPGLIDGLQDYDADGDRDVNDFQTMLESALRGAGDAEMARGDAADAAAFWWMAESLPGALGFISHVADYATGDDNQPPPPPPPEEGGGGGGPIGDGDSPDAGRDWIF